MMYVKMYNAYVRLVVSGSSGTGTGSVRAYGAKGATASAGIGAGGGGGGGGTVTSVTIAGAANQLGVTGACASTTIVNCTLRFLNGAVTFDTSGNLGTPGTVSTGVGGATPGKVRIFGVTGSAAFTVASAAGAPADLALPIVTGAPNQVLSTDGGTPQQLSWVNQTGGGGGAAGATLFSTTASTTVTAAAATTLIGAVTGSTTIPANTFTAGSVLEVMAQGFYTTPIAARTLTINLRIGGTTQITTGAVMALPSVTNGVWRLRCVVTTRTASASGTQIANCIFETAPSSLSILTPATASMQTSSTWTVDTTGTLAIDLQAAWDATTGAPTITATNVAAWIPGAPVTSVAGLTGAVPGQGTDPKVMTAGTVAGTGATLCTDAQGGATTSGCSAGGSGSFVLVEEHTASTSAALNFTTCISSTYDEYVIEILSIIPATNAVSLQFQVSTNGGSTYDTGSNYAWLGLRSSRTGNGNAGADAGVSVDMGVGDLQTNSSSAGGISGTMRFYQPGNGATSPRFVAHTGYNNGGSPAQVQGTLSGVYSPTTAVNAFRFLEGTGNIATGTIRCYGLTH